MSREAHQVFTDLPEFARANSCMVIIDEEEGEGKFQIQEGGQYLKLEFHSLNNNRFRKNAVHKLKALVEVAERGLAYIQMLKPLKEDGNYPPVKSESDVAQSNS